MLPRWELGVGIGGLYASDYIGSDEYTGVLGPIPYGAYRGERWKVDRDGIRSRLFGTDRAQLDVSFGFALPVRSSDNAARAGMPDLDLLLEAGPSIELRLAEGRNGYGRILLDTPLRAAFRVDADDFGHQGWVFQPRLRFRRDEPRPGGYWTGQVGTSLLFADDRYNDYVYGVDPVFARPDRPAYEASGGYNGARLSVTTTRRYRRLWVGAWLRYDYLGGAVNEDSPLVKTTDSLLLGFGVAWVFAQSED